MKQFSVLAVIFFIVNTASSQNVGIGTTLPTGRLQINHTSTLVSPTVRLFDSSAIQIPTLQFNNAGGSDYWQIGGELNSGNPISSYFHFATQDGLRMTLRGDGNLGLGISDPAEKLDVSGNILLNGNGELRRTATGTANLVPVCYGNVDPDGAILGGTGNFSVTHTAQGEYAISIAGENYNFIDYTVVVTPFGTLDGRMAVTHMSGSQLVVRIFSLTGNTANTYFNFVVYKP